MVRRQSDGKAVGKQNARRHAATRCRTGEGWLPRPATGAGRIAEDTIRRKRNHRLSTSVPFYRTGAEPREGINQELLSAAVFGALTGLGACGRVRLVGWPYGLVQADKLGYLRGA